MSVHKQAQTPVGRAVWRALLLHARVCPAGELQLPGAHLCEALVSIVGAGAEAQQLPLLRRRVTDAINALHSANPASYEVRFFVYIGVVCFS